MKVSSHHLERMREMIEPLDTRERRAAYKAGRFPRSALTQDVDRRYRWDLFWMAKVHKKIPISDVGYSDSHLDTALRQIVAALN